VQVPHVLLEARYAALANEYVQARGDCAVVVNEVLTAAGVVSDDCVVFFILVDINGLLLDPIVEAVEASYGYHCVVGKGDGSIRVVVIVNAIDLEHFEVRSFVIDDGNAYIAKLI